MDSRLQAAKTALALTALLAAVLVAMALLDAPWLGFVAMLVLFAALATRQVAVWGGRGAARFTLLVLAVVAVAFVVSRATAG